MTIENISISELTPLFPLEAFVCDEKLIESVRQFGLINPIIISSENKIIDGHKRLAALSTLGQKECCTKTFSGDPYIIHWHTNQFRTWSLPEAALTFLELNPGLQKTFCETTGFSQSPQNSQMMKFIAENRNIWQKLHENPGLASVLKDIANLSDSREYFAEKLISMNGTIAEKRLIAALLKQSDRRGVLPIALDENITAEALINLKRLVQPRREEVFSKIEKYFSETKVPAQTSIEVDPTLERTGFSVKTHIKRHELKRIDEIRNFLDKAFETIEEL
ncbi:MAG: ParB N-terminal domain-containing protein [Candidatus Riflebacteria bacterium]|nr:ParB N-terminal domain-containing protein [Candidatus Riflebacteria bacterium]